MIVSGKELAAEMKRDMAMKIEDYTSLYGRPPHLALVLVGDNPGSVKYVAGKEKDATDVGMKVSVIRRGSGITEGALVAIIERLRLDPEVDGIMVQLPLPSHINEDLILRTIGKEKDADGFHPENVAALWLGNPGVVACTPKGIMKMLDKAGVETTGKNAVVVGRSRIVGMPMFKLLLDRNATVTSAHSRTRDLGSITRLADILVVAIGQPRFITADMIRPGAAVVDVGINYDPETGRTCGDVDFERCREVASVITPVPFGVGPMTKVCLLENTIECYLNNITRK